VRRRLLPLMLVAGTVFALGCADGGGDPTGAELKKSKAPENAAPQAKIEKLITALFPQPEKAQAKRLFSEVKDLLSDGDVGGAQAKALDLLDLATTLLVADELLHPRNELRADAFTRFHELVREFVGLPEGTAAPVDATTGGTAALPSGDADVTVEPGSVEGIVVITITRKEGDDPCLFPIDNPQLGGCYDYTREPAGDFILPVLITACFAVVPGMYSDDQLNRFQLHKSDAGGPVTALKIPGSGHPGDDEDCFTEQVIEASLESSGLANFAHARWNNLRTAMAAVLGPQELHAAAVAGTGKRLGGLGSSFTDIGAALPVQMNRVNPSDADRTALTGAVLPTAVEVTDNGGETVVGVFVTFTVAGGGSVGSPVVTGSDGVAEASWTIASGPTTLVASGVGFGVHEEAGGTGPFIPVPPDFTVDLGTGELPFDAEGLDIFDGFETASGWTTSGFWHRSQLTGVQNDAVVDNLVNLAPDDISSGSLPAPFGGDWAFWYGEEATGNFMGARSTFNPVGGGGISQTANSGTLVSPNIEMPSVLGEGQDAVLKFDAWFEIESFDPDRFDIMRVSVRDVVSSAVTVLGVLNPSVDPNGGTATPFTSAGFDTAPVWIQSTQSMNAFVGKTIQLIFEFDTRDTQYNGFRGWVVDDVRIVNAPSVPASTAQLSIMGVPQAGSLNPDPPSTDRQ